MIRPVGRKILRVFSVAISFSSCALALFAFLIPAATIVNDLRDPALGTGAIPAFTLRWHRALTPRFEQWARARIDNEQGRRVDPEDVTGSEWPMFGAIFYLAATESLQNAVVSQSTRAVSAPREYAIPAIEAATDLVLDPSNAAWVRAKWGDDYLSHENVFYRMLLIMGLTSHAALTGSSKNIPLLQEQVESLASELHHAPSGMLDDYPGEAYPSDVLWAVAAIRRADILLGTDHSDLVRTFLEKCRRPGTEGALGLLPYAIDAPSGRALDASRGCGNSGLLTQAPILSVPQSAEWYNRYAQHFWQERALAVGFTEFPRSEGLERWWDVDAGPVLFGYGAAASAFGLSAARANGRFDHAAPLAKLAIAGSWPLPNGTLLVPRLLSNAVDAPYLGEAAMLFIFTRTPQPGTPFTPPGESPWLVSLLILAYGVSGLCLLGVAVLLARLGVHLRS